MAASKEKWICTDPSTQQYGREIDLFTFEYKEGDGDPVEISILSYDYDEIESCINSYGYTLQRGHLSKTLRNISEAYPEEYLMVIAECLFEIYES